MRKKILTFLRWGGHGIEDYLSAALILCIALVVFINVLSRYIFKLDIAHISEAVPIFFFWVSMLMSASLCYDDGHIGFPFFYDKATGTPKKIWILVRSAFILLFFFILLRYGIRMVTSQYKSGLQNGVLKWPGWIIGSGLPLGAALALIRTVQNIAGKFGGGEND